MKRLALILFLIIANCCLAQELCKPNALSQAASKVLTLQEELKQTKVGEMDEGVPSNAAERITRLKYALGIVSDSALACAKPSVDPIELQKHLAEVLHANAPEPPANTAISKDDHRYDEILGSYGHDLRIQVSRPSDITDILMIQFSTNIECGSDSMLLIYELHDGVWTEKMRWQSPPLKLTSDAFGDFFLVAVLRDSSAVKSKNTKWRVAVAHGTPWCTSRFSAFKIDLLSPGSDPTSPHVLWHTERGYSRSDFEPRIKSSENTFELRLNADCMVFDSANCFERRVIYRYRVDSDDSVHRIGPMGINARGFVSEWLTSPWSELQEVTSAESATALQRVHDQLSPPSKPNDDQYLSNSYGAVRACTAAGVFQIEIGSSIEKIVPGKPGGESEPLASHYFHVREVKDGYLMLSAPTDPDPTCSGANLMPARYE
jgi:hypothetical protein